MESPHGVASKGDWKHVGKVWRCQRGTKIKAVLSYQDRDTRGGNHKLRVILGRVFGVEKEARKKKIVHMEVKIKQLRLFNPVASDTQF